MTGCTSTLRLLALTVGTLALCACAKTRTHEGTDSTTHFLERCERDAECGGLECLCGVCTRECERDVSCSDLDDDAACGSPTPPTCTEAASVCGRVATAMSEEGGVVQTDATAPTGDAATPDAGFDPSCRRMDARSNGDDCVATAGFAWNGLSCEPVICGCAGSECAAIYDSQETCESAYRSCAPLTMCTRPSECRLATVECCACELDARRLASISTVAYAELNARACPPTGDTCDPCSDSPFAAVAGQYLPACVPSSRWEGGECTLIDLAQLRCTDAEGCRVRRRGCCECSSDAIEQLMAVPNGSDASWRTAFCDPGMLCDPCEPIVYPTNVAARCGQAGFCELLEDGVVVPP